MGWWIVINKVVLLLAINLMTLAAWSFDTNQYNNPDKEQIDSPIWGTEFLTEVAYGKPLDFREELYQTVVNNHQVLGYFKARQVLLGQMYLENNGKEYFVRDVYCQKAFTNRDFGSKNGLGPDQIPDPEVLNTEHTWPQSRFTDGYPKETQKSDLHHLFPTDSDMNNTRANNKFGEVSGKSIPTKCDTSKFGNTPTGIRFEPPKDHQGNVARAIFYFSIRYKIPIDDDEEVILRKWHSQDPVDEAERTHHEAIFKMQGNRNPFIDHPEWVQKIPNF